SKASLSATEAIMRSASRLTRNHTRANALDGAQTTRRGPPTDATPPLRNGDHLTVAEFLRRYEAMPERKKARRIDGVAYIPSDLPWPKSQGIVPMPSPVTIDKHGAQRFDLTTWPGHYRAPTPGVQGGGNTPLRLPVGITVPQPDACLRM